MTFAYVLKNFWKKGTFTHKEYLVGVVFWIVFHSVLDLALSFVFRQNIVVLRTVISVFVMECILVRRIKAITQRKIAIILGIILCIMFSTFLFLLFALIGTPREENRFIQQDLELTSSKINRLVGENKLHEAKIEARHLINLYENLFGKRAEETEELKKLLSLKLGTC